MRCGGTPRRYCLLSDKGYVQDCTSKSTAFLESGTQDGPCLGGRLPQPPVDDDAYCLLAACPLHRTGLCPVWPLTRSRGRGQQVNNSQRCGAASGLRPCVRHALMHVDVRAAGSVVAPPQSSRSACEHQHMQPVVPCVVKLKQDVTSTSSVTYALVLHMNHLWKLQGQVIGWRSSSGHRPSIIIAWRY